MPRFRRRAGYLLAGVLLVLAPTAEAGSKESASRALFARRILPIFRSQKPSSCAECHLGGVNLKDYAAPTEEETFRRMRDQGLIDVRRPEQSKILRFIRRAPRKTTLVSWRVRRQEYDAFRSWIVASARNSVLMAAGTRPVGSAAGRAPDRKSTARRPASSPRRPLDPILASFERNLWTEHLRCSNCHVPGNSENTKCVKQHGARVSWFVPGDPAATMQKIIDQGLINVEAPEKSLLLLKPTNQVPHGGGQKMMVGDRTYKAFRHWIEEVAASKRGRSRTRPQVAATPGEWLVRSECWLKIEETPPEWGDHLLGVDLFAWDMAKGKWSERLAARADRGVWGKGKLWQQTLSLVLRDERLVRELLPRSQSGGMYFSVPHRLPPGRYLIRIYCDTAGNLEKEWQLELFQPRFLVGELEVTSEWPTGYDIMTVVKAPVADRRRRTNLPEPTMFGPPPHNTDQD